ncbi:MAG: hypothetical protein U0797_06200 [Gemmataceae bacterium]
MLRFRFALTVCFALVGWGTTSTGQAALMVTQYQVNQGGGGLNIQAQYGAGDIDPDCCDPANVRWLQRVLLTDAMGNQRNNVPGYPSGNFIDPQPNQPGGPFDNLPWYDITYNTAADRAVDANRQNGAGRFFNDSPQGWLPFGAISFSALTMLVCVDPQTMMFEFLGGFSWGFSVNAAQNTVTAQELMPLADTNGLRDIINNSLAAGAFANQGWMMVANPNPDCFVGVQFLPEPGTLSLGFIGLASLGIICVRRRRLAA